MLCADYGKERGQNLPLREVNLVTGGKACVPDGLTLAPAKDAKEVRRLEKSAAAHPSQSSKDFDTGWRGVVWGLMS